MDNELKKTLSEMEEELTHSKNVMMGLEASRDKIKSELEKYKKETAKKWWEKIFKRG
jgi:hypothetical protein